MPGEIKIVKNNAAQVKRSLEEQIESALTAVGVFVQGEAMEELENAPRRVDTGNLKNSISHRVEMGEHAVYIGTPVKYGRYVHEGTLKMAPNRFLKNAIERNETQIRDYIKQRLES